MFRRLKFALGAFVLIAAVAAALKISFLRERSGNRAGYKNDTSTSVVHASGNSSSYPEIPKEAILVPVVLQDPSKKPQIEYPKERTNGQLALTPAVNEFFSLRDPSIRHPQSSQNRTIIQEMVKLRQKRKKERKR